MQLYLMNRLFLRFDTHLTNTEVLSAMADNLCKRGIVKETYKKAILDREQEFPTGLNTGELTWQFLMQISAM